ncbi:hypothetical protein HZY97_16095 [Sphingomonas sp. R-74633]|uniref:hypothetical protein n=1 Tax=Sphingomonas sp. R-74633 TaxID=2751188 RepID=UPI0015D2F6C1|nr:hypothetical protein [Sphingomonas sp. R-74633]NYT42294.1 hypothetical protein [Sphingomonas sp. R-74633]
MSSDDHFRSDKEGLSLVVSDCRGNPALPIGISIFGARGGSAVGLNTIEAQEMAGAILRQVVKHTPDQRNDPLAKRCTDIADRVVPAYRDGKRSYSCGGTTAKLWQAAWDGACIALGGEPEAYIIPATPKTVEGGGTMPQAGGNEADYPF